MYSEIIDNDQYINEDAIAMGPPIIYTEEEEEAMMKELKKGMFFPTPKTSQTTKTKQDLAPTCICKIKTIGSIPLDRPLVCLFETRSTGVMVNQRILPPICYINQTGQQVITTTANGQFDSTKMVQLDHIKFPKFINGRVCEGTDARLFASEECQYDIIFGRQFLREYKIVCNTNNDAVTWLGARIDMKPTDYFKELEMVQDIGIQKEDAFIIQ